MTAGPRLTFHASGSPHFHYYCILQETNFQPKRQIQNFKKSKGSPNPQRSKIVKSTQKLEIEPHSSLLFRSASHLFVFFPQRQSRPKHTQIEGEKSFQRGPFYSPINHNNKTHIRQHIWFVCETFFLDETPRSTFFFSSLGAKFQYPSGTFSFPLLVCFCSCFLWLWRKVCYFFLFLTQTKPRNFIKLWKANLPSLYWLVFALTYLHIKICHFKFSFLFHFWVLGFISKFVYFLIYQWLFIDFSVGFNLIKKKLV